MAVVHADERSAAGGFTGVARTTGAAVSPMLAGFLFAHPSLINVPFYIAGILKIVYDLLLYCKRTGCTVLTGNSTSAFAGSEGKGNRRIDLVGIDFFRPRALDRLVEPREQLG